MPPSTKLLPEPVAPRGWKEDIAQRRNERIRERQFKLQWNLDWTKPSDPIGYWLVYIRILVSSTKMVDKQGHLVFDQRTRRPRMVREYGYLPLVVDVEETVEKLHRRIEDSAIPALRHQSFSLELHGKIMEGSLDNYYLEDEPVILCNIAEK